MAAAILAIAVLLTDAYVQPAAAQAQEDMAVEALDQAQEDMAVEALDQAQVEPVM